MSFEGNDADFLKREIERYTQKAEEIALITNDEERKVATRVNTRLLNKAHDMLRRQEARYGIRPTKEKTCTT